jgi:hypothetical protein
MTWWHTHIKPPHCIVEMAINVVKMAWPQSLT